MNRTPEIIELSAIERSLAGKAQNTMFQSAEVELNHLSKLLLDELDRIRPTRVVLDSLSELRLLADVETGKQRKIALVDGTGRLAATFMSKLGEEKNKDGASSYSVEVVPVKGSVEETRGALHRDIGGHCRLAAGNVRCCHGR